MIGALTTNKFPIRVRGCMAGYKCLDLSLKVQK